MFFHLSLLFNPDFKLFFFMDEACEVFVLKKNQRERGRVRNRGGLCVGSSELPSPLLL